jgi:putative heme-binding domain-containing protein
MLKNLAFCTIALALLAAASPGPAVAASPAASLVGMFRSGRVTTERAGPIIAMIGSRGDGDDLAFLLDMATGGGTFDDAARLAALEALADAATTRNAKPAGELTSLEKLLVPVGPLPDDRRRVLAIHLAGAWRVAPLAKVLSQLATSDELPQAVRQPAAVALGRLGKEAAQPTFDKLLGSAQALPVRTMGVAGLAQYDLDAAATRGAEVLASENDTEDPATLVDIFINHAKGTDRLAAAVEKQKPSAAVARRALEHLYAIGRAEGQLPVVLSAVAGVTADMHLPDADEIRRLVAEVSNVGDATRGEAVFRRPEISCMKCHSVSGAGGNVGPDLSAVGGISPIEFLVTSVLVPELAVKEAFQQALVQTGDGDVYQGIVVQENADLIVLKDAQGVTHKIPRDDETVVKKGGSLMPKGLANLMSHGDFVDLVRFLSELGRPGPYMLRSTPTIQRWRYLQPVPEKVRAITADSATVRAEVCDSKTAQWQPAYGRVAGVLPLDPIVAAVGGKVLFLKADVQVTEPGQIDVKADSTQGLSLWVDGQERPLAAGTLGALTAGEHQLVFRVDTTLRRPLELRVELLKSERASATFTVVGGP